MKRFMVLSTFGVLACLSAAPAVHALSIAQETQTMSYFPNPDDPEAVRSLLLGWLRAAERAQGIDNTGSREIESWTPEVTASFLSHVPDRDRFIQALIRETANLEAPRARSESRDAPGAAAAPNETLQPLFSPDYPPDSGGYKARILDPLRGDGLAVGPSVRCDSGVFGDKYNIWYPLAKASEGAGAACTVAGCDPIGIACAITCAVVEGVRIAALIAGLSIEVCETHDGQVDSAEIEAAYENSVAAVNQLGTVESLTRALAVQLSEVRDNDDRNRDLILINSDANRNAIVANDNSNRDAITTNDNSNRDTITANDNANRNVIVANDNANRDAIIASGNANSEAILAALDAYVAAALEREIMTALGRRECHAWMYTPEWADSAQTVFLGGRLETMLRIMRKVIEQARLLGTVSTRDLELAERDLNQVLASAADRPLPAGRICRDLQQAYLKATSVHP